eukprot:CAMPEP_0183546134 /NCGR_PEP_ID=MMETSP0371-20130417/52251_1 /TAXON_ID=268820 /ORGANISM="Peridinium aciculiferum, Strain PAER-2" /LENGTH=151 /DNA_ID=CAMNT_0025748555 /DNA_START=145 /DNA_END=601 /DNA_ORIENTATION=+
MTGQSWQAGENQEAAAHAGLAAASCDLSGSDEQRSLDGLADFVEYEGGEHSGLSVSVVQRKVQGSNKKSKKAEEMWFFLFQWTPDSDREGMFEKPQNGPFQSRTEAVQALVDSCPGEADLDHEDEAALRSGKVNSVSYDECMWMVYRESFR